MSVPRSDGVPICKDCVHFHTVWISLNDIPCCDVEDLIDPVDGEKVYRRCSVMRAEGEKCGPGGTLFEAKP